LAEAFPSHGETQTVQYADGRFEVFWSGAEEFNLADWQFDDEVLLSITDSSRRSGSIVSPLTHEPINLPVALGEACDIEGLINPCVPGLQCDRRSRIDERATCQAPEVECPIRLAKPISLDEPIRVEGLPDQGGFLDRSGVSCNSFSPQTVNHYFRFEAERAGRYRFVVTSPNPAIFAIRSSCLLRHSEVSCASARRDVDGIYYAELQLELAQGQVVTVVVDTIPWFRLMVQGT
jgi:hypothetical protein